MWHISYFGSRYRQNILFNETLNKFSDSKFRGFLVMFYVLQLTGCLLLMNESALWTWLLINLWTKKLLLSMQNVLIICCFLFGFYADSDFKVAFFERDTLHIFKYISLNNVISLSYLWKHCMFTSGLHSRRK